jgi:aspartate/glutamate racemase
MTGEAQTVDPMIGLIGGLGVGAAITYYRGLAAAHDIPFYVAAPSSTFDRSIATTQRCMPSSCLK